MIGEQLTSLRETNPSPYMFSIVGWKEGTQPGGIPDILTDWVPPDARLVSKHALNGPFGNQDIYSYFLTDLRICVQC